MATYLGNINVEINEKYTFYKRAANVLYVYKEIFIDLFLKTQLYNVIKNMFPEGAFITQFTQNNLHYNTNCVHQFHQDPPHHIINDNSRCYGLQICILLTDFTKENGCTVFLINNSDINNLNYLIGKKGDVYYWPATTIHSEGINTTKDIRSCLILNIQSLDIIDMKFMLGEDRPILSFYEQYKLVEPKLNELLTIDSNKIIIK